MNVVAKGFNSYGDPMQIVGTGLMARCVQHETDHLDGVMFIERLDAGDPQAGDARDPGGRVVRRQDTDRQVQPACGRRTAGPRDGPALMRLVFAGTPAVAIPALDALADSAHEIVAVVTRPDAAAGRGRSLQRSPVGAWADERGIEVLTPARPREEEFQARLRAIAPDCVPVVAYGALVPQSALDIPKHGWINVHFSLLPAWRGAAPVQHAVLHGDEITGASVFQLEAGLDTGPVYGTVVEQIRPTDTSGDLLGRLAVRARSCSYGCWTGSRRAR